MKSTPGPWEVHYYGDPCTDPVESYILSKDGIYICELSGRDRSAELTADAAIIAAAPEMLAALKLAEQRLTGYLRDAIELNCGEMAEHPFMKEVLSFREVIAKAEGRL